MATTVSLVLGSGGARGYAHIGVIEEVRKRGYEIIAIAGCSMGALVGGMYGAGKLDLYKEWVTGLSHLDILRLVDLSFNSYGAIKGERVFAVIREMVGHQLIEHLSVDYTAVATDLTRQKEVWFQVGELLPAMRASIAIPTLFTPVMRGGRVLVDGGLLNPVPIIPTVSAHADLIIAVNLNLPPPVVRAPEPEALPQHMDRRGLFDEWRLGLGVSGEEERGVSRRKRREAQQGRIDMVYQTLEVMQSSLTQYKIAGYPPDLLIEIPKSTCRFYEFWRASEMIEIGRHAAQKVLDRYESEREPVGSPQDSLV